MTYILYIRPPFREKHLHTSRRTSYNIKRSDCWLGCHQDQHKLGTWRALTFTCACAMSV